MFMGQVHTFLCEHVTKSHKNKIPFHRPSFSFLEIHIMYLNKHFEEFSEADRDMIELNQLN